MEQARQADAGRLGKVEAQMRLQQSSAVGSPAAKEDVGPPELEEIRGHIQTLSRDLASQVDGSTLTSLSQRLEKLEQTQMAEQLQSVLEATLKPGEERLEKMVAEATEETHKLVAEAEARLQQQLCQCREAMDASLGELREGQSAQAEGPVVVCEQLNLQYRSLSTILSQKAEWSEMEQLRIRIRALSGSVARHAEAREADTEQVALHVKALKNSAKVLAEMPQVRKEVQELGAALASKADTVTVEGLVQQLAVMSDLVSQRLRNPTRRQPHRSQPPPFSGTCPTGHGM